MIARRAFVESVACGLAGGAAGLLGAGCAAVPPSSRAFPLVPKIKYITREKQLLCVWLNKIEPSDNAAFSFERNFPIGCSKMKIRCKIGFVFHIQ